MKKVISLIVAFAIVACCFVGVSAAGEDVIVTANSGTIKPGETIIVKWTFNVYNGENVASFNALVGYDDKNLELVSQDKRNPDNPDKAFKNNTAGIDEATGLGFTLEWNGGLNPCEGGFTCAEGLDEWANDIWWFSCQFKAKDGATNGEYPVTLSFPNIGNADTKPLTYEVTKQSVITITGATPVGPEVAVIEAINALPAASAITLADEPKVVAAREAYDKLGATDQAKVTNYQKLLDCEAKIKELKNIPDVVVTADDGTLTPAKNSFIVKWYFHVNNGENVASFNALVGYDDKNLELVSQDKRNPDNPDKAFKNNTAGIDEATGLGFTLEWNGSLNPCEGGFTCAEGLDEWANDIWWFSCQFKAKDGATNGEYPIALSFPNIGNADTEPLTYEVTDAVLTLSGFPEVGPEDAVIKAIAALPEANAITLADKDSVVACRNAYDELTPEQQAKVTNYSKLQACEARIAELEQAVKDAAAFDEKVSAISSADKANEQKIIDARDAYDKLSDDAKALVTKFNTLKALESALTSNKNSAKKVDDAIAAITKADKTNESAISEARTSFDKLSTDAKSFVENEQALIGLENSLVANKAAAKAVDDAISAITAADKANEQKIINARAALNGLSADAKSFVEKEATLSAYEVALNDNKAAAKIVIDAIDALPTPENVKLADKDAIVSARAKYAALSDVRKAFVTNLEKLEACEQALADLPWKNVVAAIDMLPAVNELTLEDELVVLIARYAYDELTPEQQAKVTNYSKLQAAEAKIVELKDKDAAKKVEDLITALPEPTAVTYQDGAAITAARSAYDALTPTQQGYVPNLAKLEACEQAFKDLGWKAVYDAIEALPDTEDITLDDKDEIVAVRNAYNALTPEEQARVTNIQKLVFCEARIAAIERAKAAAEAFDTMVAAIPAADKANEQKINDARTAYNDLSTEAKTFVQNKGILVDLEQALDANKTNAAAVDAEIDAIGEVKLESEQAILDARASYNVLSTDAKTFVGKLGVLSAAEARLAELKDAKADAAAVDAQIAAITAADKVNETAIINARNAYNALSPDAKTFVENEATLAGLEQALVANKANAKAVDDAIAEITAADKANEQKILDARAAYEVLSIDAKTFVEKGAILAQFEQTLATVKAAAKTVSDAIDALTDPEDITLDDITPVKEARIAYNALSDASKDYVGNLAKLEACEQAVKDLGWKAVVAAIESIPAVDDLTLEDEIAVVAARAAYELLTPEDKARVENLNKLVAAEAKIVELKDKDAAAKVDALIAALPDAEAITESDAVAVGVARAAYNALTETQKGYVNNLAKLEACEQALKDIGWKMVVSAIDALPDAENLELTDEAAVVAARVAFESLTPEDQTKVTNIAKLEADEAKLVELKDKAAAKAVDEKIIALPEPDAVVVDDAVKIGVARAAYNALTDTQKGYVENLEKLEACERALENFGYQGTIAAINGLPEVQDLTINDKPLVENARMLYNKLSKDDQARVTNYAKLQACEARIAELEQAQADAAAFDLKVSLIPAADKSHEQKIADARNAYNALSPDALTFVENEQVLIGLENSLAANRAAANAVDGAIENITAADKANEEAIIKARSDYEDLSFEEKSFVQNEEKLASIEAQLKTNKASAEVVDGIVEQIEGVDATYDQAIAVARIIFDTLSDEAKSFVMSEETLVNLEQAIAVNKAAAKVVDDQIAAITGATKADAQAIAAAKAAYESLSPAEQSFVENLADLAALEQALADSKAAAGTVDAKIDAIGEVTLAKEPLIVEARNDYDVLSENDKAFVEKLAVLEAAEKRLQELKDADSAKKVETMIKSILVADQEHAQEIKEARAAYMNLNENAKNMVSAESLQKLENDEITVAQLSTDTQVAAQPEVQTETKTDSATSTDNFKTGDASSVAVAGALCAAMALAFVAMKKKNH